MTIPTFYIPPDQIQGDSGTLAGDELRHARLTLRLGAGDTVRIVDGMGTSWEGLIQAMEKEEGSLKLSQKAVEPASSFSLTIAMGIVQGERFDWAIEKGTELGASAFLPLVTERTEVKLKHIQKRLPRLERIIVSASKQCGRARFPAVLEPTSLDKLDTTPYDQCVAFWEEEGVTSLKESVEGINPPRSCLMVIGPVGGLTLEETQVLREKGCILAGMGPRVLRTETAVTVGAALLQYVWGDMK